MSKFDNKVTENDISMFIMDNTTIAMPELFKVERLKSQKQPETPKHVSFKISTFSNEIYKKIIDEKLWSPNFTARVYLTNNEESRNDKIAKRRSNLNRLEQTDNSIHQI